MRGWGLVLAVAAGPWVGCSPVTEIGEAEPDAAAGASNVGGSAIGGSVSGQAGSHALAGSDGKGGSAGGTRAGTGGAAGGTGGAAGGAGGAAGGTGGAGADPNMVVLFDGSATTFKSWESVRNGQDNPWKNNGDGTMTVVSNAGDIISKQKFQDAFVHLEYKTPKITSAGGGQERGNSGVSLKGSYEMQVLDTYGLPPAIDGCGALYSIKAPLVVACHKEEEWNTYEIEFKANKCTNSAKTGNASFPEVKLNGMVVQQNVVADHATQAGQPESCDPKGLMLQDHSSLLPVSFRNIWVIPRN